MPGVQAVFAALRAQRDGVATVILPAHNNDAVVFLIDQVVSQRQIVGDDLHRFTAQFLPKQECGRTAVYDDAFARVHQLRSRARNPYLLIVVLRLVNIHWRPARALLADGFCAVADFFQLAAFVEFVDIASCRRRRNSQPGNHLLHGDKSRLCQQIQ